MTGDEKALLATKVMGWRYTNVYYWTEPNGSGACDLKKWHPDEDIKQAMGLAERLREMKWHVTLDLPSSGKAQCHVIWMYANTRIEQGTAYYGSSDTLAQAICTAALEVAKLIEKEGTGELDRVRCAVCNNWVDGFHYYWNVDKKRWECPSCRIGKSPWKPFAVFGAGYSGTYDTLTEAKKVLGSHAGKGQIYIAYEETEASQP